MITPHVTNEVGRLRTVVLGLPDQQGSQPTKEQTYDAKSYYSVAKGIYPKEADCRVEMDAVLCVLEKYGVEVLRPRSLESCNQVFARDVAFTIDDTLFVANLIADRSEETSAFEEVFKLVDERVGFACPHSNRRGGDVLLYDDILFVRGTHLDGEFDLYKTARTNRYGSIFLKERFPRKTLLPIPL